MGWARVAVGLLWLLAGASHAATIGIQQPADGTKYALLCERIESHQLVLKSGVLWAGMPTYAAVLKSSRVDACPPSQGNWFEFPTEQLRNYTVTVRLVRYDAAGKVLSNRLLSPFFYFHGPKLRPMSPVVILAV